MGKLYNLDDFRPGRGTRHQGAAEAAEWGRELYPSPQEALADLFQSSAIKAAAWLVRRHRAQLRTKGAVDFQIPLSAPLPRWFQLAMGVLGDRKRWTVHRRTERRSKGRSLRIYRVRWHGRRQR